MMKKNLLVAIAIIILVTPVAAASTMMSTSMKTATIQQMNVPLENFTHTVMVEYGTTTTCPYCVIASGQLYSIYNSGDLDFYYVSLVGDQGNSNVWGRLQELGISSIPDVYFDGGYRHLLGAQSTEQPYRNAISTCGEREVPDIYIDVDVEWKGAGTLKILVTVTNNEAEDYNGHLRVYVVEKTSRWDDNSGNPYHFAVLDIPIDSDLTVVESQQGYTLDARASTYTFKKTWFGALHGFGDITQDNVMVIASVFDPDSEDAVQAAAAEPTLADGTITTFQTHIHQFITALKLVFQQVQSKIQLSH